MTKIDIFSGFLGAGKTTLIKKLIREAYQNEKVVLIENEFGEIGVDGGFLKNAGIEITEMNSGCICCSLVGDFAEALKEVSAKFSPDRIIIEPSGVGKLSDVIRAVQRAALANSELNAFCTVVDAKKCKMYLKNFGEFFLDQVKNASCIVLSHTATCPEAKLNEAIALLKEQTSVTVITTDWDKLTGKEILSAMERKDTLHAELERLAEEAEHHHHDDDDDECCHGHHHDDEDECCHEHHHHHDDDDDECCHEHHHHHDDEDECCHGHHHHDDDEEDECCHGHHHHHHHADEVFTSWGVETAKKFTREQLYTALKALDSGAYGSILRAKGYVDGENGWIYFDYVPEEYDIRDGEPSVTGRLCVIGCQLAEEQLKELFLG